MIVSLHLVEEDLGLGASALNEEEPVDELQDVIAVGVQFLLDLRLVALDQWEVL
jgi:hypothetical protein